MPPGPVDYSENVTALGYIHPKNGHYQRILGLKGPCNDVPIVMDTPGETLHMYRDSKLSDVKFTDSEHYINVGATVGKLRAFGTAIVHISGTVHELHVSDKAQVYLHQPAVVNTALIESSGFMKAEFGTTVHDLVMRHECSVFQSTGAVINISHRHPYTKLAKFYDVPETDTPHIRVVIKMHRVDVKQFCTILTNQFNKTGTYEFYPRTVFTGIYGCRVYGLYEYERDIKQEQYAVEFCAKAVNYIDEKLLEALKHPGYYYFDNVVPYVEIDGESLPKWLIKHQEPLSEPRDGEALQDYVSRVLPDASEAANSVIANWQKHQPSQASDDDDEEPHIGSPVHN